MMSHPVLGDFYDESYPVLGDFYNESSCSGGFL